MKKFIIKLLGLNKQLDSLKEDIIALRRECAILTRDLNDLRFKNKELDCQFGLVTKFMESVVEVNDKHENSIKKILSVVHVGADINDPRRGSSWCVVCLKGEEKDRDIVNFFEVNPQNYEHLKEMLKQFDIFEKKALDLPHGLGKNFFI